MKNLTAMAVIALLSISSIQAQPKQKCSWHDRMMSEKIAFITMELALTPAEAQAFWPVYNQVAEEKQNLQKAVKSSYAALVQALKEGKASDKEIDKLLDEYLAAKYLQQEISKDDAAKFRKVLPGKKVAKLYMAEENFRRNHIYRMKGGHHGTQRHGTPRQGNDHGKSETKK